MEKFFVVSLVLLLLAAAGVILCGMVQPTIEVKRIIVGIPILLALLSGACGVAGTLFEKP